MRYSSRENIKYMGTSTKQMVNLGIKGTSSHWMAVESKKLNAGQTIRRHNRSER